MLLLDLSSSAFSSGGSGFDQSGKLHKVGRTRNVRQCAPPISNPSTLAVPWLQPFFLEPQTSFRLRTSQASLSDHHHSRQALFLQCHLYPEVPLTPTTNQNNTFSCPAISVLPPGPMLPPSTTESAFHQVWHEQPIMATKRKTYHLYLPNMHSVLKLPWSVSSPPTIPLPCLESLPPFSKAQRWATAPLLLRL